MTEDNDNVEDIQYYHSWRLKTAGGWKLLKFLQVLLTVSVTIFSDIILSFAVYCFTNIVNSVRVSLSEKSKDSNLKESIIDFSVRTEKVYILTNIWLGGKNLGLEPLGKKYSDLIEELAQKNELQRPKEHVWAYTDYKIV